MELVREGRDGRPGVRGCLLTPGARSPSLDACLSVRKKIPKNHPVSLETNFGSFDYYDADGRIIEVYYYCPDQFQIGDDEDEEGGCRVSDLRALFSTRAFG